MQELQDKTSIFKSQFSVCNNRLNNFHGLKYKLQNGLRSLVYIGSAIQIPLSGIWTHHKHSTF